MTTNVRNQNHNLVLQIMNVCQVTARQMLVVVVALLQVAALVQSVMIVVLEVALLVIVDKEEMDYPAPALLNVIQDYVQLAGVVLGQVVSVNQTMIAPRRFALISLTK